MNVSTTGMSGLAAPRVGKQAWLVLIATSLGNFLTGLDTSIANVAFPDIQAHFPSASRADLSWVLTFYAVSYAGLLIVAGRLADRIGRRRVFELGLSLFVLASLGVALAPSVPVIVAMRGAQGLGAALMTPASVGPAHFSVASAVGQTARQLGSAIGVAIVVAILGTGVSSGAADTLAAFDRAFLYLAAVTALAGLIATRLRPATR